MGILRYVVKRIGVAVLALLVITTVVFVTIRLTGSPVAAMLGSGNPSKQAVMALTKQLGLNKPLWLQYWVFMKGLVLHGNLGTSFATGQPVSYLILTRMPATIILAMAGSLVGVILALPIGLLSAVQRNSWIDFLGRVFALVGISFPNFWLGMMLILVFSVTLHWFPSSGYGNVSSLVLPAVTLGLILAGINARLIRSSVLEILGRDYVRTARAKGLSNWSVVMKHALRNALVPIVTYVGQQFATLLGGIVFVEVVFAWPGIGTLSLTAVETRDFPLVQGIVLAFAALLVVVNLLTDLSYVLIDPQIRLE